MPVAPLNWEQLANYTSMPFPPGWDKNEYIFFSPRDLGVHQAIVDVVSSASHRVMVNMYGYDDDQVDAVLHQKAADPNILFLMNLDKSQSGGVHEKALLQPWAAEIGTSIAVGHSIKSAISHLKICVVDGLYIISGSTNWSLSGEQKQDNQLTITRDSLKATRYESIILLNHTAMKQQMEAKKNES